MQEFTVFGWAEKVLRGGGEGQAGVCMAVGCPAVLKKGCRVDPRAKQNL